MSLFKCKMCGGALEISSGETVAVCEYCGTKQTLPKLDDERKANLYDRANHFRRGNDFDKAAAIYEQILDADTEDAEAYWSLVLCRYGIEYVEDPSSHKRIPTVNRAQFTSIFADEDYKSAIMYADGYQKEIYEQEAKAIDGIQKEILLISQKEEPFDVFICYKETDANGQRTPDTVLANDLYHELTKEGFKVFFSRITLEDKLGTAYEPYIFAALNSAKVMVVVGTKAEYFNAVWVKNEWSRYLALIKNGAKKTLIPAYRDMDPYDLPDEFSHLQAQDMSKLGFMQDLIRGIKKIVQADEPKATVVKETVVTSGGASVAPLLRRAFIFLEDKDWESADDYCEKVLDLEPENAEAYLGKLLAEKHVKNAEDLQNLANPFDYSSNYEKIMRFGSKEIKKRIKGYNQFIIDRNEKEELEEKYTAAVNAMDKASKKADFIAASERFKEISDYKDSAMLYEKCLVDAETARKREIYNKAVELMRSGEKNLVVTNIEKAVTCFEQIIGYEDADHKIVECRESAEKIRKQIEEDRLNEEALQFVARRKRIITLIFVVIFIVAIVSAVVFFNVVLPMIRYDEAVEVYNRGKYAEARELFAEIKDFKDSKSYYMESAYQMAVEARNNKDYDSANPIFEALGNYKDSAELVHYHDYSVTHTKAVTCLEDGIDTYVCSCGDTYTEVVKATGHNFDENAACTEGIYCTLCGLEQSPALGHTTETGVCERCGYNFTEPLVFKGKTHFNGLSGTRVQKYDLSSLPVPHEEHIEYKYIVTITVESKWDWGVSHDGWHLSNNGLAFIDNEEGESGTFTGSISYSQENENSDRYLKFYSYDEGTCSYEITIAPDNTGIER